MIHITTLTPVQWQLYRDIRLDALQTDPDAFAETYTNIAGKPASYWIDRLNPTADPVKKYVFAIDEDRAVGMAIVDRYLKDPEKAIIIGVYTRPSHRGRGIMTALFQDIYTHISTQSDIKSLVLRVNESNHEAAVLYEKLGFEKTHYVPVTPEDLHASWMMERPNHL